MKKRPSVTWSNSHQRLFEDLLSIALKNGQLRVTDSEGYSITDRFFELESAKYFSECMPRDMFDEKVEAWIKKAVFT
jgi:hypothetical protein